MSIHKLFIAVALAGLLAVVASAADVDGKWKSEFTTPDGQARTSTYTFKADGDKLTVTFGPDRPPREMVAKRVK